MSEPPATFEDVFSQEYWEPIPSESQCSQVFSTRHVKVSKHLGTTSRKLTDETRAQVDESLLLAVSQLLIGEPTDKISDGEQIGGAEDRQYGLPGAVLLIDRESLLLQENDLVKPQREMHEAELSRSTIASFMSGMAMTRISEYVQEEFHYPLEEFFKPFDLVLDKLFGKFLGLDEPDEPPQDYNYLNPYRKSYAIGDRGIYGRNVDLIAFCPDKKDRPTNVRLAQWRNPPEGPQVVVYPGGRNFWPHGAVGETKNITWLPDTSHYTRVREAHICLRGSLAHAKAKQEKRQSVFAKRLLAVPGVG